MPVVVPCRVWSGAAACAPPMLTGGSALLRGPACRPGPVCGAGSGSASAPGWRMGVGGCGLDGSAAGGRSRMVGERGAGTSCRSRRPGLVGALGGGLAHIEMFYSTASMVRLVERCRELKGLCWNHLHLGGNTQIHRPMHGRCEMPCRCVVGIWRASWLNL